METLNPKQIQNLKSQIPSTNFQTNPNDQNLKQKSYDLEERTLEFAKRIIRLSKSLPNDTINRELVSQLVRAGGSVGANYREAKECHYWLQLVVETNPEFKGATESLLREVDELKKIFSSIIGKSQ